MNRLREFWNHSLNPITGLPTQQTKKPEKAIKMYSRDHIDQASRFKAFMLILLILLLSGCKAKKPTVITQTIRDTINIETVRTIQVPVERIITISSPCDSLGVLKDFKQTLVDGKVKVVIRSVNNTIVAEVNIDSIKEVWVREFKGEVREKVTFVDREVPKPFIPKFVWWISGGFILSLVFNFRKFIPFLKFIPF